MYTFGISTINLMAARGGGIIGFIENATDMVKVFFIALLGLLGILCFVVLAVLAFKKFTSPDKGREISWFTLVLLLVLGGVFIYGGIAVFNSLGETVSETIEDLRSMAVASSVVLS